MSEIKAKGKAAKEASIELNVATTEEKNHALQLIADQLLEEQDQLLTENKKDIEEGRERGIDSAVLDRILLTPDRIEAMAEGVRLLIDLQDPIGETLEEIHKENGLHIVKKRVPIGVIAMIYEARPNVTIDAASLALKTGNAVVLRGSSSAKYSNLALWRVIQRGLEKSSLPVDSVQLIEDTSRETAKELFTLNDYLDVLIPRGGAKLIQTVIRESTVPVIETGAGNCHVFIDESADEKMAIDIVVNAKTHRPSVCNAIETVLIDSNWLARHGKRLIKALRDQDVQLQGDDQLQAFDSDVAAVEQNDWSNEYLDLTLRLKSVENVQQALDHIATFSTKHSESIITQTDAHAEQFLNNVDAAAVYVNASTRFTDGFEFGYGAEIGISTQKLHARGPMGLEALTSSKFVIRGTGQIR
ncbi:glutamate-5-semialdehyde dehydrogenase [Sporosarcina sp. P21c]|uniref:glutamate-5-semialdehyde dehydrogenase n=1 Tax=unclassified Sporosarcina TaxID=2647733 RepID=UPI000C16801B|nr:MULTISPECIES: glutamate-5-semialdehyde dehydrogenase [unclassified Sporosarcina]PIC68544.1 glutamate-5-semialdehyde dehydrogenase [Sporosarcina sp. P16a]PIC91271.1 glutamate-5-semialdehyde dehydrogenase [Sporosarcina sp. P21c]PIC93597.1 glutamate-5-semialdehyde dehydrogenase [Sporosarcina sp. P25]